MRGYVSKYWKAVQYEYYKEIKRKDIHAVDKWARMLIKTVLEFNRTMWKNRCNIIKEENKASYDQRQRMDITRLFQYLKDHPDEFPQQSAHFMEKHDSFFERSNLDVLLMWKRGLEVSITPVVENENITIKRFFKKQKPTTTKRKRKKAKEKDPPKSKKKKKKIPEHQSSLTNHFILPDSPLPSETEEIIIPPPVTHGRNTRSQTRHRNLFTANNHMVSYQQRLREFQNNTSNTGFKRHIEVSPNEKNNSTRTEHVSIKKSEYNHRINPSFLLPGHKKI